MSCQTMESRRRNSQQVNSSVHPMQVMQAAFGAQLRVLYNQQFVLSVASPADGCTAFNNAASVNASIVVMQRGNCFMSTKVLPPEHCAAWGMWINSLSYPLPFLQASSESTTFLQCLSGCQEGGVLRLGCWGSDGSAAMQMANAQLAGATAGIVYDNQIDDYFLMLANDSSAASVLIPGLSIPRKVGQLLISSIQASTALQEDRAFCNILGLMMPANADQSSILGLYREGDKGTRGDQCAFGDRCPVNLSGVTLTGYLSQKGGQLKASFADARTSPNPWASLAPFSSKGPTLDGRVKPDLLAPGTLKSAYTDAATGNTCSLRCLPHLSLVSTPILYAWLVPPGDLQHSLVVDSWPTSVEFAALEVAP